MLNRILPLCLGVLAVALFVIAPVTAADDADTHEGKVVSVTATKLVMTNKDGKEHTHIIAAATKVSCDGTICKLEDLKPGFKIRVTTKKDDKDVVTLIQALNKNEKFD